MAEEQIKQTKLIEWNIEKRTFLFENTQIKWNIIWEVIVITWKTLSLIWNNGWKIYCENDCKINIEWKLEKEWNIEIEYNWNLKLIENNDIFEIKRSWYLFATEKIVKKINNFNSNIKEKYEWVKSSFNNAISFFNKKSEKKDDEKSQINDELNTENDNDKNKENPIWLNENILIINYWIEENENIKIQMDKLFIEKDKYYKDVLNESSQIQWISFNFDKEDEIVIIIKSYKIILKNDKILLKINNN